MKLLLDENLSPKLVARLANCFPDSAHVDRLELGGLMIRKCGNMPEHMVIF